MDTTQDFSSVSNAKNPNRNSKTTESQSALEIVEVINKKQLKEFLTLPQSIYSDPASRYVMPLEMHMKMMMGKLGTPQKHFFLAYSKGQPVARLGVKVHKVGAHERLHFGFFESKEEFPQAAKVLVDKAHSMYPHLEMMGPFNFRQEDPYIGVLVEGFDMDPYFMMPYNSPSYDEMIKKAQMAPVMDLFTYEVKKSNGLPQNIRDNAAKAASAGYTTRALDPKNLRHDARIIAGLFNEALSNNWGFEEFLDDQVNEMITLFKLFIDYRVVLFACKDGKEVGCLLMIPNFNHLIKPSRGKLGLGLIYRYFQRKKTTDSIRGYALGIRKAHQGQGIASFLCDEMFKAAADLPYERCEISWILANNNGMNELAKGMGGKQNKVYRIYSKSPINNATHN